MEFVIATIPTNELLQTNKVFVGLNSKLVGLPTFIKIRSAVFICDKHLLVTDGMLGMNSVQRRTIQVSVGNCVEIRYFNDEAPPLTTVQWMIRPVKVPLTIDGKDLIQYIRDLYTGQIFVRDQQVGMEFDNKFMIGHISGLTTTVTGLIEVNMGQITRDTEILIVSPSDLPSLRILNVPRSSNIIKDNFDFSKLGIGGLDAEFSQIFRRAFASRIFPPSLIQELGITHVKGILLYGPPGTGKTLMARQIGKMLDCREPIIVNGPELFNRYVGASEEAVRKLFKPAEDELASVGAESSKLHLIILDEFDAMCRQRGATRDGSQVQDSVVNQLLAKMDGVTALPNILLIAMTNRKDLLEEAMLRPGRFEVHIEIALPDQVGREEIFSIHTADMRKTGHLADDVTMLDLARRTKNYTGAEIAGVVRAAASYAMNCQIDHRNIEKTRQMIKTIHLAKKDFDQALVEVKPQLGTDDLTRYVPHGIIPISGPLDNLTGRLSNLSSNFCVLLEGERGTGKTAVAVELARRINSPYIKLISADNYIGFGEMQKCNLIRKVFDDALRSPTACIILDDLERLIEFVNVGPRFSNTILQTIMVLCKRPSPIGHSLLVIGTTSLIETMNDLDFSGCFDLISNVPTLQTREQITAVLESQNFIVKDKFLPPIPIKKLLLLASLEK
jgi:vesicle-fusing ATPase